MNLRSLPQNKALFSSDQFTKFVVFAQKCVPMIRALSLGTEGTILKRRSRRACWNLEQAMGVARDDKATSRSYGSPPTRPTMANDGDWAAGELPPPLLAPSEVVGPAHALRRALATLIMWWTYLIEERAK